MQDHVCASRGFFASTVQSEAGTSGTLYRRGNPISYIMYHWRVAALLVFCFAARVCSVISCTRDRAVVAGPARDCCWSASTLYSMMSAGRAGHEEGKRAILKDEGTVEAVID